MSPLAHYCEARPERRVDHSRLHGAPEGHLRRGQHDEHAPVGEELQHGGAESQAQRAAVHRNPGNGSCPGSTMLRGAGPGGAEGAVGFVGGASGGASGAGSGAASAAVMSSSRPQT